MGRSENVALFEDTEKLCKTNSKLSEAVKNSTGGQKLILENDKVATPNLNRFEENAKVTVSKKRTLDAAKAYKAGKVVVHNFASASNPGGGVTKGANAQEECICRCSGLYFSLNTPLMWNGFYTPHRNERNPIHNDDIIYTPNVAVFKSDTANPVLMKESDWYYVDVITCAAPNLRDKPSNGYNSGDGNKRIKVSDKELLAIHEKRLRRILDVAVNESADTIILGAFGCGAFKNNPNVVAQAAYNVIKDYLKAFKNIEFAVYCRADDDINYRTFERFFKH
ncbi:MAG: TIGR02452 family protein [Lachnospiraceae bacterium]|jgi:uncharacterized protein (TIGR02452 family)|nr:TIGR02452 family protein [Lachnospiraceae bacterium]